MLGAFTLGLTKEATAVAWPIDSTAGSHACGFRLVAALRMSEPVDLTNRAAFGRLALCRSNAGRKWHPALESRGSGGVKVAFASLAASAGLPGDMGGGSAG